MYPHFINFLNPVSDEHFVVALRPLDGQKLFSKYYPQLHFVQLSIPDNNFNTVIEFTINKLGYDALREGLDALSPISQKNYKGQLLDFPGVNQYIMDAILKLTTRITADLPNWNYIQRACAANVYKIIFSAITKKYPRFSWCEIPNNKFGDSFIIYYNQVGIHLTDNDYDIINRLIKAHGEGMLIEIKSVKQNDTNYRKSLEKLIFDNDLKRRSDDIFYSFSLENYMWVKYHAVKYSEL